MARAHLKQIARLMQVYKDTHPTRIARRYGVTHEEVRPLAEKYQTDEMAPLSETLETFYGAEPVLKEEPLAV